MTPERRRGRRAAGSIAALALVAGAVAAVLLLHPHEEQGPSGPRLAYATAPVVRGTVSRQTIVQGTLRFARQRTVTAGLSGIVTGLPAVGARIGFGQALYAVDAQPIFLLQGAVPMWRPFAPGMSDGPDVQQLEAGLQAMGYFVGAVDETYTSETAVAIERLHGALGETCQGAGEGVDGAGPAGAAADAGVGGAADGGRADADSAAVGGAVDGRAAAPDLAALAREQRAARERRRQALVQRCLATLPLGSIVFGEDAVRVGARRTTSGAQIAAGSAVLGVSAADKIVTADVKLDDQTLAAKGTAVTVALPDGTAARGRVTGVGSATEKRLAGGNATAVVIPTTIGLRRQARVRRFQRAPVTVRFAGTQRRNVLSVPVEALVALDDTRFAVELPGAGGTTTRLPVRTGLFAAGRVEISGSGVHAGLRVAVPRR